MNANTPNHDPIDQKEPSNDHADPDRKISEQFKHTSSNGNREEGDQSEGKDGSAQRGGPDLDKAQERQPPDSDL